MPGVAVYLAVLLSIASWPAESQERSEPARAVVVAGVVTQRLHDYKIGWVTEAARKEPVRLCSPARVVETETDARGEFRFANVPPGVYDVVTAGSLYPPASAGAVQVGNHDVSSLKITEGAGPARPSSCVKRKDNCGSTDWSIEYEATTNLRSAVLYGLVEKRSGPIPGAWIALFRAGEANRVAGRFTDSEGRFEFLVPAGYYKLNISRKGFQSVNVATFLVPLSNPTKVTISTLPVGKSGLCK